jgi:hypothetical protein
MFFSRLIIPAERLESPVRPGQGTTARRQQSRSRRRRIASAASKMSGQEGRAVERDRPGPTGTWMIAKSAPVNGLRRRQPGRSRGRTRATPPQRATSMCAWWCRTVACSALCVPTCRAMIILFGEIIIKRHAVMMPPVHIRFVPGVGQAFVF